MSAVSLSFLWLLAFIISWGAEEIAGQYSDPCATKVERDQFLMCVAEKHTMKKDFDDLSLKHANCMAGNSASNSPWWMVPSCIVLAITGAGVAIYSLCKKK